MERVSRFFSYPLSKKLRISTLALLLALSSWSFYLAFNSKVNAENEYAQYNVSMETFSSSVAQARDIRELAVAVADVLKKLSVITSTSPFDSKIDSFSNFNKGTIIAQNLDMFLSEEQKKSEVLLIARSFIIEAMRDYEDEDFTWNLEILNEMIVEALQEEGYSQREAEEILANGIPSGDSTNAGTDTSVLPNPGDF